MNVKKEWLVGLVLHWIIVIGLVVAWNLRFTELETKISTLESNQSAEIQKVDQHVVDLTNKLTVTTDGSGDGKSQPIYCPVQTFDPHTDQWVDFIDKIGPKLQNEYPAMLQFFSYWMVWQNQNADPYQYIPTSK